MTLPKILRKVRPVCEAGRFAGGMCANEVRARARKHDRWQLGSRARAREPIFDVCFRVCSLVRFFVFFVAVVAVVVCSWSLLFDVCDRCGDVC